ncbi:MAG TPA: hypothetical protein VEV16_10635 [Daejeonella sp.]|nr:hypothetical protein [Daejeonella sp.]
MGSIIIHTSSLKDLSLLQELAHKMGLQSEILTDADKEDLVLAQAIEENDPAEQLKVEEAMAFYESLKKAQ